MDDESLEWAEKAFNGVKKCMEFMQDYGADVLKTTAQVTGAVAAAAYGAVFIGYELAESTEVQIAVATVVVGYKVHSAIKKLRQANGEPDTDPQQTGQASSTDTISIEDFRDLQKNMDKLLTSHEAVVYSLTQSEGANRELQKANVDLINANNELVGANYDFRAVLKGRYDSELASAEQRGEIERQPFEFKEGESFIQIYETEPADETSPR